MKVIFTLSTYNMVIKGTWHLNSKYNCRNINFLNALINSTLDYFIVNVSSLVSHECDILSCKFSTPYGTGSLSTSCFISKRVWIFLQNYWPWLDYTSCWDLGDLITPHKNTAHLYAVIQRGPHEKFIVAQMVNKFPTLTKPEWLASRKHFIASIPEAVEFVLKLKQ